MMLPLGYNPFLQIEKIVIFYTLPVKLPMNAEYVLYGRSQTIKSRLTVANTNWAKKNSFSNYE